MKVVSVEYPTPIENGCDKKNDNIDVFVMLENGKSYCVTVATVDWICNRVGERYLPIGAPDIIVKELDYKLIEEAVNEYAEDDAYWLRVYSMSHGDDIPD